MDAVRQLYRIIVYRALVVDMHGMYYMSFDRASEVHGMYIHLDLYRAVLLFRRLPCTDHRHARHVLYYRFLCDLYRHARHLH